MSSNYDLLVGKINEFTRKFYLNKLLRGSIYAAATILAAYICLFIFIYYLNPSPSVKTSIFFSFVFCALAAVFFWVLKPGLAYFNLGKNLSIEQAATLIGNHFFSVKDKLLNTLQLKALADASPQHNHLILAGIEQKIDDLRPIRFAKAINLSDNRRYIKYILFPISVIILVAIVAPRVLKEGTKSFIRYNEEIVPAAPFEFLILNKSLSVTQGDDITVSLKLKGDQFPQDIYLEDGVNTYKLNKENISEFSYTFTNVQSSKEIRFSGGGFYSKKHHISVNPKPTLLQMNATLNFPAYLNKKTEKISNVGDLLVPEGTKVTWTLQTENSTSLVFSFQNENHPLIVHDNQTSFTKTLKQNSTYRIIPKNTLVSSSDSLRHQVTVINDQYPSIAVEETPDSVSSKALYFSGNVTDDYGFTSLKFIYEIVENGKSIKQISQTLPIKNQQVENAFFHYWNLNDVDVKPGQTLNYYFEITDNDGVNGAKKTKSPLKSLTAPTAQEMAAKIAQESDALKRKIESTIKLASSIEKESKKLSQTLLDKKQLSFEDKKQIEQMLEKQRQLEEAVKEIKKANEKNSLEKDENNALTEELKEKQKKIDELFNQVLDDKTKELLQKLQQLMEQNRKDQTREQLSKMQLDNKGLKNELDRILELYKQLEFEQSLQNKIDRLKEMAEQQKKLGEQTTNKNSDARDLKDKQEELNKSFDALQQELQALDEKNQSLDKPNSFQNPKKETDAIKNKLQDSKEQLDKNNKEKAAQQQKDAAKEMEELAEKMSEEQQEGEEQELKTSAEELRRLLDNLLASSFEQEKIMQSFRKLSINDPAYVEKVQQQHALKDNMKSIADSLFSLSKRVPQLSSTVNAEVDKINFNIEKTIEQLGERRTAEANRYQNTAMTSINNLALMLNEALDQLEKSKSASSKSGKKSLQQLKKMQEQLNKNMQQAKERMEREGNKGTVPKGQMSKEFAEMAREQQMIREALQKINSEENKDGKGSLGNLNQTIKDMKQTEHELVNKRIEQETLNRQKNLLTKLLDAENAQQERDEDSKRESNAAKEFPPSYKQMLENFKKQKTSETELIQKLPPNLQYYYKNKIAEYFKLLNSPKN